jgi:hypothetical protein
MRHTSFLAVLPALLAVTFLSGCSSSFDPSASPGSSPTSIGAISGVAHGGRQPIYQAQVYLLQASTTAYGGPGIAASSSNKSTDLLSSGDGSDSTGFYVLTNSAGVFSFAGHTTACTTGDQVYVYSLGGKPDGSNANTAAGLMALLGTCGTDFNSSTTVNMNEASTIAAAYAFAGFASNATHVGALSTSDTLAATGIKNAFKNASQLYDTTVNPFNGASVNVARTTTPGGNGTVPQKQVDTLANVLAACVNSVGPTFSQCSTLLADIKSAGATGTSATDTATAAIYMAQHPGINVSTLYGITGSGPNPYSPWFNTNSPTDFTIAITFTGGGMGQPWSIATDANGYAWIGNDNGGLTQLTPLGVAVNGSTPNSVGNSVAYVNGVAFDTSGNLWVANNNGNGSTTTYGAAKVIISNETTQSGTNYVHNGGVESPGAVAVDGNNNAWLVNDDGATASSLSGVNTNGTGLTNSPFSKSGTSTGINGLTGSFALAVDSNNHIWVGNYTSSSVTAFNNDGSLISNYTGGGMAGVYGVAVDSGNHIWVINYDAHTVSELNNSGVGITVSTAHAGGLNGPYGIALDGDGRPWVANYTGSSLTSLDASANALSPSTGYIGPTSAYNVGTVNGPYSIQLDISGNVWLANYGPNNAVEFLGIATPSYQPLAAAVANNKLGTRP